MPTPPAHTVPTRRPPHQTTPAQFGTASCHGHWAGRGEGRGQGGGKRPRGLKGWAMQLLEGDLERADRHLQGGLRSAELGPSVLELFCTNYKGNILPLLFTYL